VWLRNSQEKGNASLGVVGAIAIVLVFILGLADLAIFLLARAKAQTAADAAALAAAAEIVPGQGNDPHGQAARFASANGARIVSCSCRAGEESVAVYVALPVRFGLLGALGLEEVVARARADVDWRRFGLPNPPES